MARNTHRYILKWSTRIAAAVLHMGFVREDEAPLSFVAGQFITLHLPAPQQNKILHRSYSIANVPGQKEIEIACSYVEGGVGSQFLFNLKPGEGVDASGPHGLFVLKEEPAKRYVLIATGTGISPYRSMADHLKKRLELTHDLEVDLLMGVRNPQELLFGEEFEQIAKGNNKFRYHICYSRQTRSEPKPFERQGHVQDLFPELNLDPSKDIIYLCGNPYMIDEAFTDLTQRGFDRKNVRREKYLFSH